MPFRAAALIVMTVFSLGSGAAAAMNPETVQLPQDARTAIAQLQKAAQAQDFAKLRTLMIDDFTWSFGGDASADQAIAAWRADDRYLRALRATLERGCHPSGQDRVECPGTGGIAFRAGLVKTHAGWRMEYLVEGD
jgi:predicted lipid-binding transport protein (Tim44 family)